jgi:hypothetical protein
VHKKKRIDHSSSSTWNVEDSAAFIGSASGLPDTPTRKQAEIRILSLEAAQAVEEKIRSLRNGKRRFGDQRERREDLQMRSKEVILAEGTKDVGMG